MTEVLRILAIGAWLTWGCLACSVPVFAQTIPDTTRPAAPPAQKLSAESLYLKLGSVGLDPSRVFRIRDASFNRASMHISLDEGTIAFTHDVMGRITGAFFEGDGEVLLIPPNQVERSSLALFTGAAVLEEHFVSAFFRFNDQTFSELQPYLSSADHAADFVNQWDTTARNLAQSDALRLLMTFSEFLPSAESQTPAQADTQQGDDHVLHARLQGRKLGTFDLYYDSKAAEQVWAGQLKTTVMGTFFDVWTAFAIPQRPSRDEKALTSITGEENAAGAIRVTSYKIRADVTPPSRLDADALLDMEVHKGGERTLVFQLARVLEIKQVEADGHPVEFIHNPSVDGTQLARRGNDLVAVVFPEPLRNGQKMKLRFVYGGNVLSAAGPGLLYVGARGMWYPNRGLEMANFDLQFRYPTGWTLVATGKRSESPSESTNSPQLQQVSRWVSDRPIPIAGFNLGKYTRAESHAGDITVETYAAQAMERSFPKAPAEAVSTDIPNLPGRPPGARHQVMAVAPPPPSPARNAQQVADTSAEAIQFFAHQFGPYPFSDLALTQMPGPLSQGWPGLIFLSSWSFLTPAERAQLHVNDIDAVLSDFVVVHETAHQWWGDLTVWSGYRDQWLIEALANYSALMMLDQKDPIQFRAVMNKYRTDLLLKNKDGKPLMDAGPVTLGNRLSSSQFPDGYDAISYGRGTWLLHMLRCMMRDGERNDHQRTAGKSNEEEPFIRALRKLRQKYEGKSLTTSDMLHVFEEELPPSTWYEGKKSLDWFYDDWVNGTAIPSFELTGTKYLNKGGSTIVSGTIHQKSAAPDMVISVPVYASLAAGKTTYLGRVFVDSDQTSFRFSAPSGTRKILLDPDQTVLTRAR